MRLRLPIAAPLAATILLAAALTACGGGGGSSSVPPGSQPTTTPGGGGSPTPIPTATANGTFPPVPQSSATALAIVPSNNATSYPVPPMNGITGSVILPPATCGQNGQAINVAPLSTAQVVAFPQGFPDLAKSPAIRGVVAYLGIYAPQNDCFATGTQIVVTIPPALQGSQNYYLGVNAGGGSWALQLATAQINGSTLTFTINNPLNLTAGLQYIIGLYGSLP